MTSGSSVLKKQFVMFRAIWPDTLTPHDFENHLVSLGIGTEWAAAVQVVNASEEFKRYLVIVENRWAISELSEGNTFWPGAFQPVQRWQERVMTPTGKREPPASENKSPQIRGRRQRIRDTFSSLRVASGRGVTDRDVEIGDAPAASMTLSPLPLGPKADDETLVVIALVLLLDRLAHMIPNMIVEWDAGHNRMSAEFESAEYTAITDGCLWSKNDRIPKAILDMKRHPPQIPRFLLPQCPWRPGC
ncbi:uncharacterized protein BO80DRAFT_432957 [Aspergillus ibericus CBS 121593]|uniref:Uncharacterized protein n=1 Tax=Aspergillus ibericus CBS 121593 TaxID=1448316 RepID=A0A395H7P4_9EURO|nr:hypothetical protein BO80DRAFT_432957 [Aspergillus ibericus CBS 121593]RAL03175.1 hypothetical protein BO80DRAFT_432957 [Aspergillus ibericus CBS 121593]